PREQGDPFAGQAHRAQVRRPLERVQPCQSKLATMIPDAVTDGQFTLHYQPLVDLGRDQIVGFEALARWRHPDYGTLQPDTFIGLAEETGAIGSLGAHLLRQACAVASSWAVIGGAHPF